VVTVGSIHGGTAYNIIPERVELVGTVRTLKEEVRERMPALLEEIAGQTAAAHGCQAAVTYERGTPVLVHDEALTRLAEETLRALLGPEGVRVNEVPCMGAEDFAFFAERVPATQLAVGCTRPGSPERKPFHHPQFDLDEACLAVGAQSAAAVALAFLSARGSVVSTDPRGCSGAAP
jgi:amidohydrolase